MRETGTISSPLLMLSAISTRSNAKGCLKGALVGGVAGHYTVHHGLLGAAAGCIIGRHEAKKRAQMEREKREHPIPATAKSTSRSVRKSRCNGGRVADKPAREGATGNP